MHWNLTGPTLHCRTSQISVFIPRSNFTAILYNLEIDVNMLAYCLLRLVRLGMNSHISNHPQPYIHSNWSLSTFIFTEFYLFDTTSIQISTFCLYLWQRWPRDGLWNITYHHCPFNMYYYLFHLYHYPIIAHLFHLYPWHLIIIATFYHLFIIIVLTFIFDKEGMVNWTLSHHLHSTTLSHVVRRHSQPTTIILNETR